MFRGFNLVIPRPNLQWFGSSVQAAPARTRSGEEFDELQRQLEHEDINGDELKRSWFNGVPAQIFLSHSGSDQLFAYGLARYLEVHLGVKVFVDSRVWGGADKLLKAIDGKYCLKKAHAYDYEKRNYSTSHVHMMLATALTEMIDQCECVIFLNTPQSIQASDAEHRATERLASPWIYHELTMTRLLARHLDRASAVLEEQAALESRSLASDRKPPISYAAPLEHLGRLSWQDVQSWAMTGRYGNAALDWLYRSHAAPDAERALFSRCIPAGGGQ